MRHRIFIRRDCRRSGGSEFLPRDLSVFLTTRRLGDKEKGGEGDREPIFTLPVSPSPSLLVSPSPEKLAHPPPVTFN